MADFVPSRAALFDSWLKFLIQYVTLKCSGATPEWTHIPQAVLAALADAYAAWYTAYSKMRGPHTTVDRMAKDDARAIAETMARSFINQYLRFPPVTDEDRLAMGIPNKDTHPTPKKVPDTSPSFSIIQMGPGTLGIIYRDGEKGRKGSKPKGVDDIKICMGVSDEPIIDPEMLPSAKKATKCPSVYRFRAADRGKRAYFASKWELRRGDGEGPWSEIQSEIIP
jgi:hypothetical protein